MIDDWHGCYADGWQGEIVPEAFQHPAKFSCGLIRRIYQHAVEEGWLKTGDCVIDPFGGVALGALDAMKYGLSWVGVELEERFCLLGQQNIDLWMNRYANKMPNWGSARLIQGDSRNLLSVIREAGECVSSPPFTTTVLHDGGKADYLEAKHLYSDYGCSDGNLGNLPATERGLSAAISSPPYADSLERPNGIDTDKIKRPGGPNSQSRLDTRYSAAISSPPYADGAQHTGGDDPHPEHVQGGEEIAPAMPGRRNSPPYADAQAHPSIGSPSNDNWGSEGKDIVARRGLDANYGSTPGQLGSMKAAGFEAAVSSPPFLQQSGGHNVTSGEGPLSDPALLRRHDAGNRGSAAYGKSEGQLEQMPVGEFEASVSSPPYSGIEVAKNSMGISLEKQYETYRASGGGQSLEAFKRTQELHSSDYGDTAGNIGNSTGSDFWSAARLIMEQTYQALAPGAHAIWVVKAFVKNKKLVDFPGQWWQLCEACGFITLHEHRAWLVEDKGTQFDLEGNGHKKQTERKSFFRRLAEKKGSPRIDWEVVLCMAKP